MSLEVLNWSKSFAVAFYSERSLTRRPLSSEGLRPATELYGFLAKELDEKRVAISISGLLTLIEVVGLKERLLHNTVFDHWSFDISTYLPMYFLIFIDFLG
jgi:hypothetical protein